MHLALKDLTGWNCKFFEVIRYKAPSLEKGKAPHTNMRYQYINFNNDAIYYKWLQNKINIKSINDKKYWKTIILLSLKLSFSTKKNIKV